MKVRQAAPQDVDAMNRIIGRYATRGLMLPRSRAGLLSSLQHYVVAEVDGRIVGCGGLQPYSATSGEIYGLATDEHFSPKGAGRAIVEALLGRARGNSLAYVFALTLAPGFFEKIGFRIVAHRDLPLKVWTDCVACPKFGNCDEIAMVLDLTPAAAGAAH
jgi:N-acetylglutamate synthase-like GNAT family acetyltransferase